MYDVVATNRIVARLTLRAVMARISESIGKSLLSVTKESC